MTHVWGSLLVVALVVGSVLGLVAWFSVRHVHQHGGSGEGRATEAARQQRSDGGSAAAAVAAAAASW